MFALSQSPRTPLSRSLERATTIGWFLGVADTNDVIQKIEKTLNNTHTTTQKLTNNSFRNTKKHPTIGTNERTAEGSGTVAGSNCTPLTCQWEA